MTPPTRRDGALSPCPTPFPTVCAIRADADARHRCAGAARVLLATVTLALAPIGVAHAADARAADALTAGPDAGTTRAAPEQGPSFAHRPPEARPARNAARCELAAGTLPRLADPIERGADFLRRLAGLGERERDAAIRDALLAGNLPGFLRRPVPVELSAGTGSRDGPRVTVCVLPDYLSVGTDDDHVLVPMSLHAALAVGEALGFTLPTRRLVDAIYAQARVRLAPRPMPPGDAMRSTEYFARHNDTVRAQRAAAGRPPHALAAGHKKDLVLTNRLWDMPGRLALYGWHRDAGAPIQPLSTVHGARYADYSHGIRLVGTTAFVDGAPRSIFEVLRDPRLAPALSDEGPIPDAAELHRGAAVMASAAATAPSQRSGSDLQQRNPRW